jgi:hypothetical protein
MALPSYRRHTPAAGHGFPFLRCLPAGESICNKRGEAIRFSSQAQLRYLLYLSLNAARSINRDLVRVRRALFLHHRLDDVLFYHGDPCPSAVRLPTPANAA